jgi:predicted nucleotidyltransferase component of viral defense system
MIRKQDILDRAAEWQLRPEIVEKDYVLGWLLAGVATTPLREHWVFKGGTSIRKCYFETYRFSEDLDFSLLHGAAYGQNELLDNLRSLADRVSELSGIEFPPEAIVVRERRNLQGQLTFEGRVGYRGPLAYPSTRKILFDLTQHEAVLEPPADRFVLHPYPDELSENATVRAYGFNELLAEKTRALFERSRPRDLYDVIHLLENAPEQLDLRQVRDLFVRKCAGKGLTAPTAAAMVATVTADGELRSEWGNMLAHQLPALPDLDAMLAKLPALLGWLDREAPVVLPEAGLVAPPIPAQATPFPPPGIHYWGPGLPLETIRFAGSNRLLLEFDYHGRHRLAEPYAVRRAVTTGNVLLYAWETGSTHIKAFNVAEMANVRPTGTAFTPRYRLEFSESGPFSVSRTTPAFRSAPPRPAKTRPRAWASSPLGPRYVFECPYCQKRFTHGANDPSLRKHKRPDGWGDCPGRRGHLVDTR